MSVTGNKKTTSKLKTTSKQKPWLINKLVKFRVVIFIAIFALIGTYTIFISHAATPPAAGVTFHCTWGSYTDADRTAVLDKLATAKVEWVRIDMGWSSIEYTGPVTSLDPASQWYTKRMDFCVNQAKQRGLKVLVVLSRTPSWANNITPEDVAVPPTNPLTYATFANKAASYFKGRVNAWEVWNEADPNQSFWKGTVAQYVDLLKAAYPQLKSGDPNTKVVLAGPSTNDDAWIGQVYSFGAKNYFDVLATHPYQGLANQPPEYPDDGHTWWFTHLPAVLRVMQQYSDGSKEVWFTEFGWSSHLNSAGQPNWQLGVTPDQQGDYLVRSFKYAQANYPNVTTLFWYNDRNRNDADIQNNNYGLLNADLTEKPAYTYLKNYLLTRVAATDTTSPTTSITSPVANSTVNGKLAVGVNASDNIGITRIELFVDGTMLSTNTTTPASFVWDTTAVGNGLHTLQAKAYDAANNVGATPLTTISVSNATMTADTVAPVVTINAPANNSQIYGNVTITATATDAGGISSIEVRVDGNVVATSTNSNTIVASWSSGGRKSSKGAHSVTVQAIDKARNSSTTSITVYK